MYAVMIYNHSVNALSYANYINDKNKEYKCFRPTDRIVHVFYNCWQLISTKNGTECDTGKVNKYEMIRTQKIISTVE